MQNRDTESFKQLTVSVEKLPASMAQSAKISTYATERAQLLLGCYRSGEANDPDTYVAAIAATLARYSAAIITDVTHPVSGLPARLSWLPTVKEVFTACEAEAGKIAAYVAREKRIAEQLAARAEEDRLRAGKRLTIEELKAKYGGDNWGLKEPPRKQDNWRAPAWDKVTEAYAADPSRLARLIKAADDQHPQRSQPTESYADEGS
jgi:hypothetical protein